MLDEVAIDDFLGKDNLAIKPLVGGSFHPNGGQLFFEKRNIVLLFRHDDFDVVVSIRRKDKVDIFQADINTGRKDLLYAAFEYEMAFVIGLSLVKKDARFVDEIFVGEKPNQSVGLIASSGNRHVLGVCHEEA